MTSDLSSGMAFHLQGGSGSVERWIWASGYYLRCDIQHLFVSLLPITKTESITGVIGSLAAGFQSFMYGGFTPAGGIFAILTSLGMRGILQQVVGILAAGFATGIAFLVGRST